MNEQAIQELKDALREVVRMVVERREPLNDELKKMLAQVMEHVANRIQELREEEQNPVEGLQPNQTPQLEPGPYPSSNINAFKYDPETGKLLVKFHGQDSADSGPTYGYEGVPAYIFDVFKRGAVGPKTSGKNQYHEWFKGITPSLGAAMNALIKNGGFPYQRLS